ncbi:MAG: 2-hydroxyglutaryl-CoA dehydratase [Clostridiales bacterium GWF2_38_85]|nr:MAG: 2-hydroxyglutaryl-CoA dehydratase [Clostridiales bacterium GWF2_38_85]HBL84835.1 2-hydroxyglutaryl-CoA dehydratase [Clostridiales bacterium]
MTKTFSVGIDIGSTTAKIVLLKDKTVVFEKYERHFSQVRQKTLDLLEQVRTYINDSPFTVAISGSAGLGLAEAAHIPFVQEVFATGEVIKLLEPDASAAIELGGEDAKIIFLDDTPDERMNGSCAGGTGAFIDQMATLLNVTPDEMDELSLNHTRIYPIASRCGVFAKTDIQPLLNQGAKKEDVAASIYQAVVNQSIAGLAQGRKISGKILFLGGPLYYCKGLRKAFKETLHLSDKQAVFPKYSRFAVAFGAAIYAVKCGQPFTYDSLVKSIIRSIAGNINSNRLPSLFASDEEYQTFIARHNSSTVRSVDVDTYTGIAYLGIDCGSTTTKLVLLTDKKEILYSYYSSNKGSPVEIVREQLNIIYEKAGDRIKIVGSAVIGYGEELIKNAFNVDIGVVETIAHYTAAKYFCPNVDFILDIGGQDIKCFKIRNNAIDSIMLNEACSSGCGSFIETFAKSMEYSISDFAEKGLFSKSPVNLGSRCTVFMNSSVKQSQKDGALVADISAGLATSVVKNAIYKVIRAGSIDELGKNIVVQGGTFYNDAILRAFEIELGRDVIRPNIAGLMGAYGAALHAMKLQVSSKSLNTSLITKEALSQFTHTTKTVMCSGCTNHCHLTVNTFSDGRKYISGNQCEKGFGLTKTTDDTTNLYEFKRNYLLGLKTIKGTRGKIGLPLALGTYELLPLWHTIFTELGFEVVVSEMSSRRTYEAGQFTIPSDTICYPAKLMHGHIEYLLNKNVDAIFYPCMTYNVKEKNTDNHYNCPIVAYYSELLNGNMEDLKNTGFLYPYLNINNRRELSKELTVSLQKLFDDVGFIEVRKAVRKGFAAYAAYMKAIRIQGEKTLEYARKNKKRIMILAGRPYHIDLEIGHGIDKLATTLGFVVVSEDSICHLANKQPVNVLNQWTYHARLYKAARYAAEHKDTELVQLVSFGCGVDAITTDEVCSILESKDKYYTQIKIDEITNLGAVRIRLRSLLGALEEKGDLNG